MKIGVAITTYNRRLFTEQLMKSILWSNPKNVSVVIVDNNSTDGTQDMLAELKEKNSIIKQVVYNPENKHGGYAFNQGMEILATYCDVVGGIANDVFAEPGWDRNMSACFEELNLGYLISLVRPAKEKFKKITSSGKGHYIPIRQMAACTFLRSGHFQNGFKFSIVPWGKGRIGPMPEFQRMLDKGFEKQDPLTGATLATPGFLARQPEYTNPDFTEYYDKTFGKRVMLAELAKRRKLESEGNANLISFEYKHSLNWREFLTKYYPEMVDAECQDSFDPCAPC